MKKAVLLSMLCTVSALTIFTGAKAQKGFYIGAQKARQLSVMFNKDDVEKAGTDYKYKISGSIGISSGYNFTNNMGVGTDLNYSSLRQRYIYDSKEYTQQFNYIKVPLMFTLNSNPDAKVMFTAKAGPQIGILTKAEITDATDASLNGDIKDRYNKITFGAMAGTGARLRLNKSLFLDAGLRFDGTFTNTEKKTYSGYLPGRAKTYDLNAGVEVGIKFFFN